MTDDLIAWLREEDEWTNQRPYFHAHDKCIEAADRIEELETEAAENARIIGMSAEREMALRGEIERLRSALKELVEEYVRNVDCTRLGGFYLDPETEDCIIDARAALEGTSHE